MKHSSSELKRLAKGKLLDNYSVPMGAMVIVILISLCTAMLSYFFVPNTTYASFPILSFVIDLIIGILMAVISTGVSSLFLNLCRGKDYRITDIFYAFRNNPDHAIGITVLLLLMTVACILPLIGAVAFLYVVKISIFSVLLVVVVQILCVVGAVWITLTYSQALFLYIDNPDKKVISLLKESKILMKGNKGRLFYLYVSFLGLTLLSVFTCYIAFLWVGPYMNTTLSLFYLDLKEEI